MLLILHTVLSTKVSHGNWTDFYVWLFPIGLWPATLVSGSLKKQETNTALMKIFPLPKNTNP